MAQTKAGAIKISAKLRGMTPEEFKARLDAGEKWCYKCKAWKQVSEFNSDKSRDDGRQAVCKRCSYKPKRSSPGKRERSAKRLLGLAYCRICENWLPIKQVQGGLCEPHRAEDARQRYNTNERVRMERRQHTHARQRGVKPIPVSAQEELLEQFEGKCAFCGKPATTWDHIIPISKGGQTVPWNVVPACASCNSSKKDRDWEEWLEITGYVPAYAFLERLSLGWCPIPAGKY